ncbi:transposase [Streptomyces hygroscopicus]|uniref:transposase n=1 Tax=Streptomyces hygroscopicus TaxID=1912 RepID=UPI0036383F04
MRDALAAAHTALTMLPGLGTVLAAKLLGHVGDVTLFPSEHHFASYTGTAPLDASSGKTTRHRLNTGGNRALNSVLHIIAICQIRDGGRGQEYYLRKIAEGKAPAVLRRRASQRTRRLVGRLPLESSRLKSGFTGGAPLSRVHRREGPSRPVGLGTGDRRSGLLVLCGDVSVAAGESVEALGELLVGVPDEPVVLAVGEALDFRCA